MTASQPVTDPPTGTVDAHIAEWQARLDASFLLLVQGLRGNEDARRLHEVLFPVAR